MSVSYYTKNGTLEQKHFDNGDNTSYRPSEIAREIIMNALYEAVKKQYGEYSNYYLQQVEKDWGTSRAVAVRKKMIQFIGRIFKKYHTSKFDMSGHPIVHDVFHEAEKHGELKFF